MHVDSCNELALQSTVDELNDSLTNLCRSLNCGSSEVRCDVAVGSVEKNVIVLLLAGCLVVRRLLIEHVDCSCSNLAFSQSVSKILLIYEAASGSVNDPDASLALIELLLGKDTVCLLCLRCMKCDEVADRKELIKSLASCNSELIELLLGNIRIVSYYVHAYTLKLSGYD